MKSKKPYVVEYTEDNPAYPSKRRCTASGCEGIDGIDIVLTIICLILMVLIFINWSF